MKKTIFFLVLLFSWVTSTAQENMLKTLVIAKGQMPNITTDANNTIHLVYGSGDSIMYLASKNGESYSKPSLVAVLPDLFASAMRGPQISVGSNCIIVTACSRGGNIFSYRRNTRGSWSRPVRINDRPENAKEGLMSLSSDGLNSFAVWLGVKGSKGQNVYGSRSSDGGSTWSKDMIVYASPDSSVCECCKPSVVVKGNEVFVMFRNWLGGNRDMYLTKSANGGRTFQAAGKLGKESWKLNGCPMDGGAITINSTGNPETVWRREGKIYYSTAAGSEKELGAGKGASIVSIDGKNVYAWAEAGLVLVVTSEGKKIYLGKGSLPLIRAIDKDHIVCIYQDEKQIYSVLVRV